MTKPGGQGKAEDDTIHAAKLQVRGAIVAALIAVSGVLVPVATASHHDPCITRNVQIAQALDQHPGLGEALAKEDDGYDAKCGTASSIVKDEESSPPPNSNLSKQ